CIINRSVVLTGSMNPTHNGAYKNDNNIIVVASKKLAKNYQEEFDEMWQGEFQNKKSEKVVYQKITDTKKEISIQNYFCPEDGCEMQTLRLLAAARKRIRFMTFSFTSDAIGDFLIANPNDATVEGIFEARQISPWSEYARLVEKYGDKAIKKDENPYAMHHKVFIVDDDCVLTGSYNPSRNGNENNDENLVIVCNKKIAKAFIEEFERIADEKEI
ncbi:MAG: phospholipase D-like domain-containing protein, partial [Nanoarchaeota archaeon]